jgi:cysteine synthase A
VIFGQPPKKRSIPGLGSSISPPLVKEAIVDEVVIVNEVDTVRACHHLLRRHGLFVGGSTGTVYSAIQRYFSRHALQKQPQVLFFCCDRGTAYLHNVFSAEVESRADDVAKVATVGSVGLGQVTPAR